MFINRGMNKEEVVHIYMMEFYSAIKKNEITSFAATWMDLGNVIYSKVTQSEEKYFMTSLNVESKKINVTNKLTKYKETHRFRE